MAWRLIADEAPARGARNMAVDHALLDSVQEGGQPVLRLYRWRPACLSFGRNQHVIDTYDRNRIAAAGIDVVRRPTGGLAVLHHHELTYCVLAPLAVTGGPRTTYKRINEALLFAIRALGVDAWLAGGTGSVSRSPRSSIEPCFQAPASGEIMADGRKLVGSAQRCERGVLLQHGSLLLDGSQDLVRELLIEAAVPDAADGPGAATLRDLTGSVPDWEKLCDVVVSGFADVSGTRFAPARLTHHEIERADRLESQYVDEAWTWRR